MRQYVKDLGEAWEVLEAKVEDTFAVGDVVLVRSQLHYRGKRSGIDTTSPAGYLAKFRGGRIRYIRSLRNLEEALEAVGLSE